MLRTSAASPNSVSKELARMFTKDTEFKGGKNRHNTKYNPY